MGREHDLALSFLLATTALTGAVTFGKDAEAVPYSSISTITLGNTAISGGGLGTASSQGAGSVALFAGSTSTGAAVITQDGANKTAATIQAGSTSGSAGIVVLGTHGTLASGGGTSTNGGILTLSQSGTNVYVGTGAVVSQTKGTIVTATTGAVSSTMSLATQSIINDAATIKTLATTAATTDFTVAGGTATLVNSGRRGYTVIDVTGQLTTKLTLEAGNANDYFFVYLSGGIGASGGIVLDSPASSGYATPVASNVIVDVGGTNVSTINQATAGNYIVTGSTLNVLSGGVITGGVFVANATTSADELLLSNGAIISPDPWNGYIASGVPEPGSLAAFASGVVALGVARRRKRRGV